MLPPRDINPEPRTQNKNLECRARAKTQTIPKRKMFLH